MAKLNLKTKIGLLLIISAIVSVVIIYFVSKNYLTHELIEMKKMDLSVAVMEQSHELDLLFKNKFQLLESMNSMIPLGQFLNKENTISQNEINKILSKQLSRNNNYLAIYLLDKKGKAIISTDESFIGKNFSFRNYFNSAINGESYADFAFGSISRELGYYFSQPVFYNDNIIGVLVLKVGPEEFNESLSNSNLSESSDIMIVDEVGVIISSNNESNLMSSVYELDDDIIKSEYFTNKYNGIDIIDSSKKYIGLSEDIDNYKNNVYSELHSHEHENNNIYNILQIDNTKLFLISETNLSHILDIANSLVLRILLLIILVLFLFAIFIYLLLMYFVRPVNKLVKYFSEISKGNFGSNLDIKTNDEFELLANSAEKMSKELELYYKNIDIKVKKQTEEIKKQYRDLEDKNLAILNILEDIEIEKNNAITMANDLEKFKLALDSVSDQIVITDKEGIVLYANNAMEKITGYKKEEAIGKKAGTLWKVPMSKDYYKKLWSTIKVERKTFTSEIVNRRKNGELYNAIISISTVLDKDKNILFFVSTEKDITIEKNIDRSKSEFVSLASHQLRTPLSAINWYTEMLLSGDVGELNQAQRDYLLEVSEGNKRMVDLVDGLLNVSRLDMGTFVIEKEEVNINELINSVYKESFSLISEKNIKLDLNFKYDFSKFISDKKLFRMIIQNLISNAVKYSNINGEIEITLDKLNKNNLFGEKKLKQDSLCLSVKDTGIGIPENQKDKIFSRLFRADNAKNSEVEGTGLGLYLINSIVNKSGGEIWFESEVNKGTIFYTVFPITGMHIVK